MDNKLQQLSQLVQGGRCTQMPRSDSGKVRNEAFLGGNKQTEAESLGEGVQELGNKEPS